MKQVSCVVVGFAVGLFAAWLTFARAADPYVKIPLQGAGAVPNADPAPNDTKAAIAELTAEVRGMRADLNKLIGVVEEELKGQAPNGVPAALESAATKCYGCHAAAVAVKKAKGFTLFTDDGRFRPDLSERETRKCLSELEANTMPPKDSGITLSAEERAELTKLFKAPVK